MTKLVQPNIQQVDYFVSEISIKHLTSEEITKNKMEKQLSIDPEIYQEQEKGNLFKVSLSIKAFECDEIGGYEISLTVHGIFNISDELKSNRNDKAAFVKFTALPCIINQTRLYIKSITSGMPLKDYMLPMISIGEMSRLVDEKYSKISE